jgi:hypothetical protein
MESAADADAAHQAAFDLALHLRAIQALGYLITVPDAERGALWERVVPQGPERAIVAAWIDRLRAHPHVCNAFERVFPYSFRAPTHDLFIELAAPGVDEEVLRALLAALRGAGVRTVTAPLDAAPTAEPDARRRVLLVPIRGGKLHPAQWALLAARRVASPRSPTLTLALALDATPLEHLPPMLRRLDALVGHDPARWGSDLGPMLRAHLTRPPPVGCPFRGLQRFRAADARWFFGREVELFTLRAAVLRDEPAWRWISIEAPSGSGKSSFVLSALAPSIAGGLLDEAPVAWRVVELRPFHDPERQLAAAMSAAFDVAADVLLGRWGAAPDGLRRWLREVAGDVRVVLAVDQAEELVTRFPLNDSTRRFDAWVSAAMAGDDAPLWLVTTVRSDFADALDGLPALRALRPNALRPPFGPLQGDALRESLDERIRLSGVGVEPGLVDAVIRESVRGASLAMVEHALRLLWEEGAPDGERTLRHATLTRLGGVAGAFARSAETMLEAMPERERAVARTLLLRLVSPGRGTQDVRQPQPRRDLERTDLERAVLAQLLGAGGEAAPLLSLSDGGAVEILHDALLTGVEPLHGWIQEARKTLEARDQTESAARAWEAAGRPGDGLPRGALLDVLARCRRRCSRRTQRRTSWPRTAPRGEGGTSARPGLGRSCSRPPRRPSH